MLVLRSSGGLSHATYFSGIHDTFPFAITKLTLMKIASINIKAI